MCLCRPRACCMRLAAYRQCSTRPGILGYVSSCISSVCTSIWLLHTRDRCCMFAWQIVGRHICCNTEGFSSWSVQLLHLKAAVQPGTLVYSIVHMSEPFKRIVNWLYSSPPASCMACCKVVRASLLSNSICHICSLRDVDKALL